MDPRLEALDCVAEAAVSHETGTARLTLTGEPDEQQIRQAVEEKGYTYTGME